MSGICGHTAWPDALGGARLTVTVNGRPMQSTPPESDPCEGTTTATASRKRRPSVKPRSRLNRVAALYARDGRACHWCGLLLLPFDQIPLTAGPLPPDYPTIDHLVPWSKGGTHDLRNLVVACSDCNQARGDSLPIPDTA